VDFYAFPFQLASGLFAAESVVSSPVHLRFALNSELDGLSMVYSKAPREGFETAIEASRNQIIRQTEVAG
jgi:hypothetical protein